MEQIKDVKKQAIYKARIRLNDKGDLGSITHYLNADYSEIGFTREGETHKSFSLPWNEGKKALHEIIKIER